MNLHLVRHGETDWNDEGRIQGWIDVGLNETGRAQAREAAAELSGEKTFHLVTSPLRRARRTADILADELSIETVHEYPEFKELNQGHWNGLRGGWLLNEGEDRFLEWTDSPTSTSPPGGESLREVRARVHSGLKRLIDEATSPCVLVAHKVVNSLVLHLINGGPLETVLESLSDNAEVRTVQLDPATLAD